MPPEPITDPNNPILSRELFERLFRDAAVPILILLVWLSWVVINRLMSPERQQARRNRAIRKAVAAREARFGASKNDKD